MRHLSSMEVGDLASRMGGHQWSWGSDELAPALAAFGLAPQEPFEGPSMAVAHPTLPGVESFVVRVPGEPLILSIDVTLTEVISEDDAEATAELNQVFKAYGKSLASSLGEPAQQRDDELFHWDRVEHIIELRNIGIAVTLLAESKNSRRAREGGCVSADHRQAGVSSQNELAQSSSTEVAHMCSYLLEQQSPWHMGELEIRLARLRWRVREIEPDGLACWIDSVEETELKGLASASAEGNVERIEFAVTSAVDELDDWAQAQLDGMAERLLSSLPQFLGAPTATAGLDQVWRGGHYDVSVRRDSDQVSVTARRHGAFPSPAVHESSQPVVATTVDSELDASWAALGLGLTRLLSHLVDSDWIVLWFEESIILSIARDRRTVWVLAAGSETSECDLRLSEAQEEDLTELGFRRPLGDRAESSAQCETWWSRVEVSEDPAALHHVGGMMTEAARYVYGAVRPSDMRWDGAGLSQGALAVLASLDIPGASEGHGSWPPTAG